jgi:hypothetical protein
VIATAPPFDLAIIMPKRIRDLAGTIAVLGALFGALILISPHVRDRAGQFAGNIGRGDEWTRSQSMVSRAVRLVVDIVSNYAGDNTYLFSFMVMAVVFVILMLRA